MIQRIVLIKLKDAYTGQEARGEVAEHSRRVLGGLPGVVQVQVGEPAEAKSAKSWDLSIVLGFARLEDVEPYRVHPEHRAYVDDYLKPRMEVIKAWNFAL